MLGPAPYARACVRACVHVCTCVCGALFSGILPGVAPVGTVLLQGGGVCCH